MTEGAVDLILKDTVGLIHIDIIEKEAAHSLYHAPSIFAYGVEAIQELKRIEAQDKESGGPDADRPSQLLTQTIRALIPLKNGMMDRMALYPSFITGIYFLAVSINSRIRGRTGIALAGDRLTKLPASPPPP